MNLSFRLAPRRCVLAALVAAFFAPGVGEAQIGPSYTCGNAKTNYRCKLWIEVCNRGELDVNAIVGWHFGENRNTAQGLTSIRRKECAMVSQRLAFNLDFLAYVDGKPASLELDSERREITYYRSAGLLNAAMGERPLSARGGNASGRTCVPSDLSSFKVDLLSWNDEDSCPRGYVPVPLSNYFEASIDNWEPLTGTVNFYLYIYPRVGHARALSGAVSKGARTPSLVVYKRGEGAPEDPAQAARFYRRLGETGDQEAQYNLGVLYEAGAGVPQNYEEAARWYRMAGGKGHTEAQKKLGDLYFHGDGVPRDLTWAYVWYYLAASREHREASFQRMKLLMVLNKKQQRVAMQRVNELRDGGADPLPQFLE